MPEDNGKQNLSKYQKQVACIDGCKLVYVDDNFSERFKLYLGEDTVSNFINSMVEESNYCSNVMKKYFDKELIITGKDNEDF